MRTLVVLLALAAGLAAAVPALSARTAAGDDPPTVQAFAAALGPRAERPRPAGAKPGAGGLFSAIVTRDGSTARVAWTLTFSKLTGAAAASHIHLGKAGAVGGVAVELCGPCTSGAHGETTLRADVATAMLDGSAYVNVHTAANQGGEIRGQVAPSHALGAGLVAANELPTPVGAPADAKGAFSAIVIETPGRPQLVWSLDFSGLSGGAAAAHVHYGKPGTTGGVAFALCAPCASGAQGRRAIDPNLAKALQTGDAYVNVHTAANRGGEIRGQLVHATQGVATRQSSLGAILTDDRGMTLYMWTPDTAGTSTCYGRCAVFWPPAYAYGSAPVAAGGAKASLLSTSARSDGTRMLAYGKWPLYGFLPDRTTTDLKGQGANGFGAPWWVVAPATGEPIAKKP